MKKRTLVILVVLTALLLTTSIALADKPVKFDAEGNEVGWEKNNIGCNTIQSGELDASDGSLITTGFDEWGYNYQAHMFNGYYCDSYSDAAWCQPYAEVELLMKWNDAWLSKVDCDGDFKLDRHYGFPTYSGSGAWLTNHQSGSYEGSEGQTCNWNYFVKIVAVPSDAHVDEPYDNDGNGTFYNLDGTMIGSQIWGAFAVIQQVENDACAGIHGLQFNSPDHSGLGGW